MSDELQIQPRLVDHADEVDWDDEADIIVVGFGGAGAVAAIEACQCGGSVIAVDRFDGGGATAYSGGVIYAGETRYLREQGYHDTANEMYTYLAQEGLVDAVGPKTLRRFCDGSNDDIEWIAGFGVEYGGKAFEGKTNYPPDGFYLYYSGNEQMPAFAANARPAPRGHRVAVNGFGGDYYFGKLKQAAFAHGARLIRHAPATRIVVDARQRVVGVEINQLPADTHRSHQKLYKVLHPWRPFNSRRAMRAADDALTLEREKGRPRLLRARKGVIISAGGYNHSAAMIERHHPLLAPYYHRLLRLGSMGDDGSGIRLGQSVGGATERMDYIGIARTIAPPEIFAQGILINERGERFFNEAAYAMRLGIGIMEQPAGKAWLILNRSQFRSGLRGAFLTGKNFLLWGLPTLMNIYLGGTRKARSLTALAARIKVDPAGLARTVLDFNAMISGGRADPLGKAASLLSPIDEAPFYAVNFSMDNSFAPAQIMTTGGLAVDGDTGLVKRADGSPVIGLYAAGRAAAGIVSNGFVSGLTIADTVFSGRRAGRAATGVSDDAPGD